MDASFPQTLANTRLHNGTMASRWTKPVPFPSIRPSIVHASCRGTDSEVSPLKRKKRRGVANDDDEDSDLGDCPSTKKFLSEEDMANHLQQLQLTTSLGSSLIAGHTQAVDGMGVSHYMAEASYYPYPTTSEDQSRSWEQPCTVIRNQQMVCDEVLNSLDLTPSPSPWEMATPTYHPSVVDMDDTAARPNTLSMRRKKHYQDTSEVAIRLIPPTPTLTTPTHKTSSDNSSQEVLLEDVSEDSSDDNTTSGPVPEVWLAPEIKQVIRESQDDILPSQILQEMSKPSMQLVPYIQPDLRLKQTTSKLAAWKSALHEYEKTMDSDLQRGSVSSVKDNHVDPCITSAISSSNTDTGTGGLSPENDVNDEDEDDMEL